MKTPIDDISPGLLKRREFLRSSVGFAVAGLALPTAFAQDLGPYQERDWSGNSPLRYPDPDLIALDNRFRRYILFNTPIRRHHVGTLWAEGPAWNGVGRYLVWSDIPSNQQLRWIEDDDRVTVFRDPAGNSNGNTFDFQGRQLSCEHGNRRVVRYEYDGTTTVIADSFEGTALNSPNDVVVHPDGSIWFTDPPYGMSYGGGRAAGSTKKGAKVKAHGMIKNDDLQGESLVQLVADAVYNSLSFTKEGAALYSCLTWRTYSEFETALNDMEKEVKACIVWDKKSIGLGQSNYRPQHEFIFYCGGQWYGDKKQSDVWYLSRGNTSEYVHPTQKPVELIEIALENSSKAGDIVIDCFGGSGSTLIACEKQARGARLMELDEKYADAIVLRWQDFTGKDAIHAETGKTYNEMKAAKDGGSE